MGDGVAAKLDVPEEVVPVPDQPMASEASEALLLIVSAPEAFPAEAGLNIALTLALARRPQLLVLDEPMAMLDPLARHDFMATVMTAIADDGLSVVLSSHVLAELERVADYLVLMSGGRVQVAGEVDDLLAGHQVLTGPAAGSGDYVQRLDVVHAGRGEALVHLLVRNNWVTAAIPPGWESHPVSLEELTLAYMRGPESVPMPGPARPSIVQPMEVRS